MVAPKENPMLLSRLSMIGRVALRLTTYGPTTHENLVSGLLLKLKMCSSSTVSLCLKNSKENILVVRKDGRI